MNKKKLSQILYTKCLKTCLLFYAIVISVCFIAIYVGNSRVWHGTEPFYYFLRAIADNGLFVVSSVLFIGTLVIVLYYWKKTLEYIEAIVAKTKTIYELNETQIEFDPELIEIEKQLNEIKYNIRENQRVAKEAEQRKNDLVVYLAHDLKTPLTSIIGYLTLLHDEEEIKVETRQRYLGITLEKAERLEELINEFFEITRFNLSQLSLELSTVNLTRMLEQVVFEFQPLLMERNLTCHLDVESDLMIKIDVNKMYRVFDNVLRNAINYSYEGTSIQLVVTQKDHAIKFKLSNIGPTIPQEKIERIFEQFYRLDTSRGTKRGGAGLGLAITKKIIELHHGTITVKSKDELIVFEFYIPVP